MYLVWLICTSITVYTKLSAHKVKRSWLNNYGYIVWYKTTVSFLHLHFSMDNKVTMCTIRVSAEIFIHLDRD